MGKGGYNGGSTVVRVSTSGDYRDSKYGPQRDLSSTLRKEMHAAAVAEAKKKRRAAKAEADKVRQAAVAARAKPPTISKADILAEYGTFEAYQAALLQNSELARRHGLSTSRQSKAKR